MDMFGIGQAMKGMLNVYIQSSRRSGRTMSMVENIKNGDRVVFTNHKEAGRVRRLCEKRNVDIECIIVDPETPERLFEKGVNKGRTVFDHSWVENFYLRAIEKTQKDIDYFEMQMSGNDEVHADTRRKDIEIMKWNG